MTMSFSVGPFIAPRTVIVFASPIPIDCSLSAAYQVTITAASTLVQNPTNKVIGMRFDLVVIQDGVGGRQLTWDTNFDFGAEGVPNMAALTAGRKALVSFEVITATQIIATARMSFAP